MQRSHFIICNYTDHNKANKADECKLSACKVNGHSRHAAYRNLILHRQIAVSPLTYIHFINIKSWAGTLSVPTQNTDTETLYALKYQSFRLSSNHIPLLIRLRKRSLCPIGVAIFFNSIPQRERLLRWIIGSTAASNTQLIIRSNC